MSQVPTLKGSSLLRDRGPPLVIRLPGSTSSSATLEDTKGDQLPAGDPRHYVYVDNLGVMSTCREVVSKSLGEISTVFEERGLSLHPGEVQSEIVDTLGCRLSGTKRCVTLRPARLWRLSNPRSLYLLLPPQP